MSELGIVRPACSLDCFDACAIIAHARDGRFVRLAGDPEHPFTRGALRNKVNHYLEQRFHHPGVLHPLRRTKDGWERIGWEATLDLIAGRLRAAPVSLPTKISCSGQDEIRPVLLKTRVVPKLSAPVNILQPFLRK